MPDWRNALQSKRTKYFVLAFALADGAGIYYAHSRLNQPWVPASGAASEEMFAQIDMQPATLPEDRDVAPAPALALGSLAAPLPLPQAIEFAPLPTVLDEAPAPEAPALVPSVKLALRAAPARAARYLPARGDRRFASAFATDITGSAPAGSLPEPSFGFGPAQPGDTLPDYAPSQPATSDAAPVSAAGDYAADSQVQTDTPTAADPAPAAPPVAESGNASTAELPAVEFGPAEAGPAS